MSWLGRVLGGFRGLWHRERAERDLDEELRAYLDAAVEQRMRAGTSRDEALRAARVELGSTEAVKDAVRDAGWESALDSVVRDLRHAARSLRQSPGFTITALATLVFGVALNTAVFSLVNGLLLRPWPLSDPHEVVTAFRWIGDPGSRGGGVSPSEYRFLREHAATADLVAIAQSMGNRLHVQRDDAIRDVPARIVSGNYFDVLRVPIALGRGFRSDEDDFLNPAQVVVIGHALWHDLFGAAPDAIGRSLRVNDVPFTVIGVAAERATDSSMDRAPNLWVPLATYPLVARDTEFNRNFLTNPDYCCVALAGRLRDGASPSTAMADLSRLSEQFPGRSSGSGVVVTGTRVIDQPWDPEAVAVIGLIAAGVLLVLLVACANVGNLQLARAMTRRRELAIRGALGASRARLVWHVLTEGLLIAGVAAAVSMAVALGTLNAMLRILALDGPADVIVASVAPNLRVFLFSLGLAAAAVLTASIGPAFLSTRRLVVSGPRLHQAHVRLRSLFLAAQVALSIVLLIGAALLGRGMTRADRMIPDGTRDVVRVDVELPVAGDSPLANPRYPVFVGLAGSPDEGTWQRIHDAVGARLGSAMDNQAATAGRAWPSTIRLPEEGSAPRQVSMRTVSPQFFGLLGIRLLAGDLFRDNGDPADVVVNESVARLLWPGTPALGREFISRSFDAEDRRRVIGIVSDAHWFDSSPPGPAFFVRGTGPLLVWNAPATLNAARAAVAIVEPAATVTFARVGPPVEAVFWSTVAAGLASTLGLAALGMSSVGVFGVLAYLLTQRSRELAIRIALGARAPQIAGLITRETLGALGGGALAGLVVSVAAAPMLRRYLFGLGPYDPIAFVAALVVMLAALTAAAIGPLRRAVSVDPALTLRQE